MIKLEESISVGREGVSCFPSRQCSIRLCSTATTNLSHSSLSRKTNVQSFSLSLSPSPSTPQPATYDRAPIPHIYTPSKHLNYNESNKDEDIQAHDFSINHRSTPWLVTGLHKTPIIDLGLDTLVDISCIGMYVIQAYTSRQYYARVSEGSTHRERNNPCKSSNRSIACGGEFKVKVEYMLGGRR